MPFPFGKSQKSPAEIVRNLKENVACLEKLESSDNKKSEKVTSSATCMNKALFLCVRCSAAIRAVIFVFEKDASSSA